MARSRYEWLKDEQAKEQRKEQRSLSSLQRGLAVMSGAPVYGAAQRMGNTGFGEDGVLQRSMPTMMVNTQQGPRMIHEGEEIIRRPGGRTQVVPARQSALMQFEQKRRVPGYKPGGSFYGLGDTTKWTKDRSDATEMSRPEGLTFKAVARSGQQRTVGTKDFSGVTADTLGRPIDSVGKNALNTNYTTGTIRDAFNEARKTAVMDKSRFGETELRDIAEPGAGEETIEETGGENVGAYDRSLDRLSAIASGMDPYAAQIRAQELRRLKGEEQAARGALEQGLSQAGMTGREALTERAMLGAESAQQQADLMGELRQQESQQRMQAAMAEPGVRAQQKTLELQEQRQTFDQGMQQANFLMDANDYEGAARTFEQLTNNGADMSNATQMFNELLADRKMGRFQNLMNNFTSILPYLDESAAGSVGAMIGQMAMRGMEVFGGDVMGEEQWAQIDAFINDEGESSPDVSAYMAAANKAIETVSDSDDWLLLQNERPELFDGSEENTETLGKIAAALIRQNNGNLNDEARSILEKYGLYNEGLDIQGTVEEEEIESTRGAVIDNIESGNLSEAKRQWEKLQEMLPEEERGEQTFAGFVTNNIDSMLGTDGKLITTDPETLKAIADATGENNGTGLAVSGALDPNGNWMKWVNPSGAGNAHWEFYQHYIDWLDDNMGKILTINGVRYVVTGYFNPGPDNENARAYVRFYNIDEGRYQNTAYDDGYVYGEPFAKTSYKRKT